MSIQTVGVSFIIHLHSFDLAFVISGLNEEEKNREVIGYTNNDRDGRYSGIVIGECKQQQNHADGMNGNKTKR